MKYLYNNESFVSELTMTLGMRHVQFRSFADKDSTVTESSKEVIGAICGVILCLLLIVAVCFVHAFE